MRLSSPSILAGLTVIIRSARIGSMPARTHSPTWLTSICAPLSSASVIIAVQTPRSSSSFIASKSTLQPSPGNRPMYTGP